MTDEAMEQDIVDKGLTAPRISLDHVREMLSRVQYRFEQPQGTTLTLCHAFLDDSFYLGSGTSACVSPENFNADVGETGAQKNALRIATDKLYELEGYRLWQELHYGQ